MAIKSTNPATNKMVKTFEEMTDKDVDKAYDENGKALDKANSDKLAAVFIKELLWCINADKAPKHD